MPFRRVIIRPGVSTPADPVWSRFTQISPRSDSEFESVLTLIVTGFSYSRDEFLERLFL